MCGGRVPSDLFVTRRPTWRAAAAEADVSMGREERAGARRRPRACARAGGESGSQQCKLRAVSAGTVAAVRVRPPRLRPLRRDESARLLPCALAAVRRGAGVNV